MKNIKINFFTLVFVPSFILSTIIFSGCGGIFNSSDVVDKIKKGAALVQIYTGFIYEGPSIIKKILN